jgi:hypothetical protein
LQQLAGGGTLPGDGAGTRNTAASLAISSGAAVKHVQRMLGHQSAAMTLDVYASLFEDDLDALSDRLDAAISEAAAEPPRNSGSWKVVKMPDRSAETGI